MKALLGSTLEVLVEGPSQESEFLLEGRHQGQAPEIDGQVYLALGEGKPPRQGDLVRARVTGFADYDLAATIEDVIVPTRVKRIARLPVLSA
jgi:ribosomal protein S12 methylthiotransferase